MTPQQLLTTFVTYLLNNLFWQYLMLSLSNERTRHSQSVRFSQGKANKNQVLYICPISLSLSLLCILSIIVGTIRWHEEGNLRKAQSSILILHGVFFPWIQYINFTFLRGHFFLTEWTSKVNWNDFFKARVNLIRTFSTCSCKIILLELGIQ